MNKNVLLLLVSLLVVSGGVLGYVGWRRYQAREREPVRILGTHVEQVAPPGENAEGWLQEFTLTERSGEAVDSEDLHGKVQVACFFFARCQASCRKQTETMRTLQDAYLGKDVVFLSITCDPSFDTPASLRKYADEFDADENQWLFLTGDMPYLRRVGGEAFLVHVDERVHVDRFVVRDKSGKVRDAFDWRDPAELVRLKVLVDELLAEDESTETASVEEPSTEGVTQESESREEATSEETSLPRADSPETPAAVAATVDPA